MTAVSATLPVNPLAGMMVMVEVLPDAVPAATVTAVPLTVNDGLTPTGFTVTVVCFVTPLKVAESVTAVEALTVPACVGKEKED